MGYDRVIIDGHSLLFAWPELRRLHQRTPQRARQELVAILTQFQDATHIPVTLVFDGGKRVKRSAEPESSEGVELLYSEPGQTADAVIERRVGARERREKVLVVTNDRIEQLTVESFGAETMSAELFADWVGREAREFGHRLADVRHKARAFRKFP